MSGPWGVVLKQICFQMQVLSSLCISETGSMNLMRHSLLCLAYATFASRFSRGGFSCRWLPSPGKAHKGASAHWSRSSNTHCFVSWISQPLHRITADKQQDIMPSPTSWDVKYKTSEQECLSVFFVDFVSCASYCSYRVIKRSSVRGKVN